MKDPNEIIRTSTPKSQVRDKISTHSRVDFTRISDAADVLRVGKHYTLLRSRFMGPGLSHSVNQELGAKDL